jgi:hypothetical protein
LEITVGVEEDSVAELEAFCPFAKSRKVRINNKMAELFFINREYENMYFSARRIKMCRRPHTF